MPLIACWPAKIKPGVSEADYGHADSSLSGTLKPIIDGAQTSYEKILKSLGGTGSAAFALSASTDPQGTSQSTVRSLATVDGVRVYNSNSENQQNVGRSKEELGAALQLEAGRAVLAALQASTLPEIVGAYLRSIDVSIATLADIEAALSHAKDLKVLVDAVHEFSGTPS